MDNSILKLLFGQQRQQNTVAQQQQNPVPNPFTYGKPQPSGAPTSYPQLEEVLPPTPAPLQPIQPITARGLLVQNDRNQLLKDAEDAFYGGGQAPPQPTPKPSPTPQKGKNFQFTA